MASLFLGALGLFWNMLKAFWESGLHTWLFPFEPVSISDLGLYTTIGAFSLALVVTLFTGLYLRAEGSRPVGSSTRLFLVLGVAAWVLGGGAFWLVGEKTMPQLHFSADRFTLPFMLGASLLLVALLALLDKYPRLQTSLLAVLIGFSVGKQFQANSLYRHDWETTRGLFWQMSWRMPALEPGTTVLTNDLPVTLFSDNSLSGPLNWIYSTPGKMEHILYFASVRTEEGRALGTGFEPGQTFQQNYLAAIFSGDTSKMVVLNFSPPGCVRVLDPEIDPLNRLLPPLLRDAARLSNPAMILTADSASLPEFFDPEVPRGWCYDYSRAALAAQNGNWDHALEMRSQALQAGEHPNDPLENFLFIEAFARTGKWDEALSLSKETYKFSKEVMRPTLCALWNRIERTAPEGPQKSSSIQTARAALTCP